MKNSLTVASYAKEGQEDVILRLFNWCECKHLGFTLKQPSYLVNIYGGNVSSYAVNEYLD